MMKTTNRLWRVRGQGRNGPAEIRVRAADHSAAVRAAAGRRIRVESCVLAESMEQACREHAAAELRYQASPKAALDRLVDQTRRAAADRKAGHVPGCSLTRCAPGCRK
jgi:hypothetical protein